MKTQTNYYMAPHKHTPRGNNSDLDIDDKPSLAAFGGTQHPVFSRAILFDQEINEMTSIALRAEVMAKASEDPNAPIFLFLGSPGGGLYESLAIYDVFQAISNPIIAICSGKVMSGGILILLACDVRLSTPNTTFMIHHGHTTLSGNVVQLKEQRDEIESLNDRMLDIIIKKTKISREQLKAWLVKDHYMNVTNSITHGLIDYELNDLSQLIVEPEPKPKAKEIVIAAKTTKALSGKTNQDLKKKAAKKKKVSKKKSK